MKKPTRRELLRPLRRTDLVSLTNDALSVPCSRESKDLILDRLVKTRAIRTQQILETLSIRSLNRICEAVEVPRGPTKTATIARLLNEPLMEAGDAIRRSLKSQGFTVTPTSVRPPSLTTKQQIREVHRLSVQHKRDVARPRLERWEPKLLSFIANGADVDPNRITPRIRFVDSGSDMEQLFRYAALHWSIPVSSGYGRRLRAMVFDNSNDKLIGLIGLCDPVFALRDRDEWIGWSAEQRRSRISGLVDAYVLGAIPPYSRLLCGKFVAMLTNANEIRSAFQDKYAAATSVIRKARHTGKIAAITTTSALGRSSIYNRLKYHHRRLFLPLGFTAGSGDFQFLNGAYELIQKTIGSHGTPTAKNQEWGTGYRNRREVVQAFLQATGIPPAALQHGIKRQVFIAPLANNTQQVLTGAESDLDYFNVPAEDLWSYFRERWLLPRAKRITDFKDFDRNEWKLWGD